METTKYIFLMDSEVFIMFYKYGIDDLIFLY